MVYTHGKILEVLADIGGNIVASNQSVVHLGMR